VKNVEVALEQDDVPRPVAATRHTARGDRIPDVGRRATMGHR
jgi:hypothetical protein